MTIQEWFDKRKEAQIERRSREARMEAESTPGLWVKCVHCEAQLTKKELEENPRSRSAKLRVAEKL